MSDNTAPDDAPNGRPWETAATVKHEWTYKDIELLLSGDYADAVVICKDKICRKVHRGILSRRSDWFRKAFEDADTEEGICKIEIDEYSWSVDLILYFFYVGYIHMANHTLTAGYSEMVLGVKLIRLGNTLDEDSLQDYGYDLLNTHLSRLVEYICDPSATTEKNEDRFNKVSGFLTQFFWAVHNAFDTARPVAIAQSLLASFAFNARAHLFKNERFVSFVREREVPEFGSMVLDVLMTVEHGASLLSQDLQSCHSSPPSEQPEHSSVTLLSRTPSPGYYPRLGSSTESVDDSELSH